MADTTTPLGRLMHDFRCVRSEEKMYYEVLAKQAGAFKNTEKGVIHMSSKWEQFVEEITAEAMESGMEQGMARGMERGEEKAYLSSIRRMMEKLSVTAEKAMDVLAIPQSEWGRYKAML